LAPDEVDPEAGAAALLPPVESGVDELDVLLE
jgi:hypothetical protein